MTIIPRSAQSDPEFAALAERYRELEAVARQMLRAAKRIAEAHKREAVASNFAACACPVCRELLPAIAAAEAAGIKE